MHRQSLGSPSSKLVIKDENLISENQKQFHSQSSSSTSTVTGFLYKEECKEEAEELKKLMRLRPKTTMSQSYIHLIPMLTLLCFLILYLSSHDPSQNDLAQFNGLKTFSNPADSGDNISEMQRISEINKGDILAIRSLKNLKQETAGGTAKRRRLHRKIAHF
ncbi:hypothetical protein CDL12_08637 [Handroanthus impetiginosus]|uniref:Uncharacterized protein n=1 Tax=Handroanthus impetiginosus TaxID=429701 RepID=A0A2G9HMD9_9LAMI|nr:hypothetical protein CDL12_21607 [Handroanthus impetiginosus]PIN18696.1 hypothetical protein CDL12_08637 [Handroanthus impetiginosus]